jgi:hypothetical protein
VEEALIVYIVTKFRFQVMSGTFLTGGTDENLYALVMRTGVLWDAGDFIINRFTGDNQWYVMQ